MLNPRKIELFSARQLQPQEEEPKNSCHDVAERRLETTNVPSNHTGNGHFRLGVDIGGTFTDLVLIDETSGKIVQEKVETTVHSPAAGVMAAIKRAQLDISELSVFVHGTTLGLNALLERKGAPTGLICTRGFRDVLEIGRLNRPHMYDVLYRKQPALVPRYLRYEISERMNHEGKVIRHLNEKETRQVVRELKRRKVRAIAVSLLHSYANPAHEIRVREIIRKEFPEAYISLSSDILRQFHEYERTVSAVIDASIKSLTESYLLGLEEVLTDEGFRGVFLVTRTGGGAMTSREARQTPIHTILSGPAGAVQGAAYLGQLIGQANFIATDMGGTSFDVSLLYKGHPLVRTELEIAGYETLLPALDIHTIGAGGGSIAWIDAGNALQVGPQSAGADPGPICYGKGGIKPTVTDAAVCLGFVDPNYFLGGELKLNCEAARRGIEQEIARPLGLSLAAACHGILTLLEAKMTDAIRGISIERGFDPREFALLACGGGGPLFATLLAEKMGISRVVVPRGPGNFSAWGMLMSDLVHDFSRTRPSLLDEVDMASVSKMYEELESVGQLALERDGVLPNDQLLIRSVDMKYRMVGHTITVPVTSGMLQNEDKDRLHDKFENLHQLLYGYKLEDPVQTVNFRVRAVGTVHRPTIETIPRGDEEANHALKGVRKVPEARDGYETEYRIYRRHLLAAGNRILGPAIIEEPSSTTILHMGQALEVDRFGNLLIRVGTAE